MVSVFPKEFLDNCEHVHKYLKMDKIGEGSYGEVYIGEHRKNKQKVAMKKLLNLHVNDIAKAAYQEIELLSKLKHKNIIELIDVCQSTGLSFHLYTIFPLCNLDLSNLIENTFIILTNPIIKDIMQQLLDGISYIHSNNVIHRDLKPQNIFISENGSLKIGDFGAACEFKRDNSTEYSSNAFSFWYRPPELLLGATNYGPSADLWCIGCIFAELWIRTPLFQGNSVRKQLSLITQLCGPINTDTWPSASKLKLYGAIQLKEDQLRTIKKLEIPVTDSYGLDLLDKLLVLNPIKRITAADALMHEYFKNDPQPAPLKQLIDDLDL